MMDNETRILILEKSFNYVEEIITECYVEDDEKQTFAKIDNKIAELLKTTKEDIDRQAIYDAMKKLETLSFEEIAEIYDTLI